MAKKKKHRQYRSNQGRSPVRQNQAELLCLGFIIAGIVIITIASLL
jgi:hypothetical protein|tara:strand:+ start:238 stop:375 length:138 start_codon:yes stop_codon:yes gene_type:complete